MWEDLKRILFRMTVITVTTTLILFITQFNSYAEYPRPGLSEGGTFNGFTNIVLGGYYFLYKGDRLSFEARIEGGPYLVNIQIMGLFSGTILKWSDTFDEYIPRLPTFIPEKNDWYIIIVNVSHVNRSGELNIQYSISTYEDARDLVVENSLITAPYIILVFTLIAAGLSLLSIKNRNIDFLEWEISSLYKWILPISGLIIFIDTFEKFHGSLIPWIDLMGFEPNISSPTTYSLYESIYKWVDQNQVILTIVLFSVVINLINISYYLDGKYQRIYYLLGMDLQRFYLFKWFSGYIMVALPYVLAKIYVDIVILGVWDALSHEYIIGLFQQVLLDFYTILYLYTIIFVPATMVRSMAASISILMAPLITYIWIGDDPVIGTFFNIPMEFKMHLMRGCPSLVACLGVWKVSLLFLPAILLIASLVASRYRDLE